MTAKKKISKKRRVDFSTRFTEWVGSVSSLAFHTLFFIGSFASVLLGFPLDTVLLVLTTVVSLEAIYLAIFIQMTVNKNTKSLHLVEKDIDDIQEDIDDIQEDVEEIQEDIDDIQEDVEEIQEGEEETEAHKTQRFYADMEGKLHKILSEIEELKKMKG